MPTSRRPTREGVCSSFIRNTDAVRCGMRRLLGLVVAVGFSCGGNQKPTSMDAAPAGDGQASDASSSDAGAPVARLMYVSTGAGNALKVVELQADGSMVAKPALSIDLGARTGAMAYARTTRRLFMGVGQDIATFSVDQSGVPTLVDRTLGTGNPVYLEVAKTWRIQLVLHLLQII